MERDREMDDSKYFDLRAWAIRPRGRGQGPGCTRVHSGLSPAKAWPWLELWQCGYIKRIEPAQSQAPPPVASQVHIPALPLRL